MKTKEISRILVAVMFTFCAGASYEAWAERADHGKQGNQESGTRPLVQELPFNFKSKLQNKESQFGKGQYYPVLTELPEGAKTLAEFEAYLVTEGYEKTDACFPLADGTQACPVYKKDGDFVYISSELAKKGGGAGGRGDIGGNGGDGEKSEAGLPINLIDEMSDLEALKKKAEKSGKTILVVVSNLDTCPYCQYLAPYLMALAKDPEASKKYEIAYVDLTKHQEKSGGRLVKAGFKTTEDQRAFQKVFPPGGIPQVYELKYGVPQTNAAQGGNNEYVVDKKTFERIAPTIPAVDYGGGRMVVEKLPEKIPGKTTREKLDYLSTLDKLNYPEYDPRDRYGIRSEVSESVRQMKRRLEQQLQKEKEAASGADSGPAKEWLPHNGARDYSYRTTIKDLISEKAYREASAEDNGPIRQRKFKESALFSELKERLDALVKEK